jgi:Cu/Ag efflux pump CusA
MPGLKTIRSQSLFGLSDIKMNWHYGSQYTYEACRQQVINRMATISQPLPPARSRRQIVTRLVSLTSTKSAATHHAARFFF